MSRHPFIAALVAALVGVSVWGILAWRARQSIVTTAQLCVVIARIIDGSDRALGTKGAPLYHYWRTHPEELRSAHRANRATLAQLPCTLPKETP